jgi:hypothetical protein
MTTSREVVIQIPVAQAEDFQQHWDSLAMMLYPNERLRLPPPHRSERLDAGTLQWVIPTLQATSAIAGMIAAVSTFLNNHKGKAGVREAGVEIVRVSNVRSQDVVKLVETILTSPPQKQA